MNKEKRFPDKVLAVCLFENATLHVINFYSRIKALKEEIDLNKQTNLFFETLNCSLALIFIYLSKNKEFDNLSLLVLEEYNKYIHEQFGEKEVEGELFSDFIKSKLQKDIKWLAIQFERKILISKISARISSMTDLTINTSINLTEKLIQEMEVSMKHFKIIDKK